MLTTFFCFFLFVCLDNVLGPIRRQVIIWTKDGLSYVALGLDHLEQKLTYNFNAGCSNISTSYFNVVLY